MPANFDRTAAIAASAGNTVVKAAPGRIRRAVVTTAGTNNSGAMTVYDNASAGSGTVVGVIAGNAALGTIFQFLMPCALGITVVNVSSGPAVTFSFD